MLIGWISLLSSPGAKNSWHSLLKRLSCCAGCGAESEWGFATRDCTFSSDGSRAADADEVAEVEVAFGAALLVLQ